WLDVCGGGSPRRLRLRPVRGARRPADVRDDVAGGHQAHRRGARGDLGRPARQPLSLSRAPRAVPLRRLHRRPLMNDEARKRWVFAGIMLSIFLAAIEATVVATAIPTVVASPRGVPIYPGGVS